MTTTARRLVPRSIVKVAAGASATASLLLLAMPQVATAGLIAPESPASPQASSTNTIYWVLLIILIVSILGVAALFARSLRSKGDAEAPDAPSEAAERRMQFRVGGALTITALLLFVVGIFFTNDATTVDADQSDADPVTIQVDGQQWVWRYGYPVADEPPDGFSADAAYSYHELVIPVNTPITLDISSIDVMHRLSIPALGVAADAVPGVHNETSFVADEVGVYQGRSTRFSGGGYPTMRTVVRVVEPSEFEDFLSTRSEQIKEARDAVGERVDAGTAPGVEVEIEE